MLCNSVGADIEQITTLWVPCTHVRSILGMIYEC